MFVFLKKLVYSIVFNFVLIFLTLFFLLLLLLIVFLPSKTRNRIFNIIAKIWSWTLLKVSGTKLVVIGKENLPDGPPFIIAFNHLSNFDIYAMAQAIDPVFRAVMKKEIMYIPLFGVVLLLYDSFPIDRKNIHNAKKTLKNVARYFNRHPYIMAITGTRIRNRDFFKVKLKKGPVVTAIQHKIPILPVTLIGPDHVQPKGAVLINPGKTIEVIIHPPVKTDNYTLEDRDRVLMNLREIIGKPLIEKGEAEYVE
ncbi:1-acyl-sn-glycerol-3-phosphate acyltransferase [Thermotomaculum hydrothermale]|uniref:1-acyl-sn-glycerol-3-phosphate acyltransferase n=1 Tax=Thermotomaculum hydrothermale TaxID=981385 RepID=A0A7R6PPR7_9BACT|nr:lysophospholipid acyltransferase family protein [Thermotomaculum hydrothermale]BBB32111.1 1-acyl-sn-glycerol-3-phosphate acyltransferase [Thermotomaculum hydrothermale]